MSGRMLYEASAHRCTPPFAVSGSVWLCECGQHHLRNERGWTKISAVDASALLFFQRLGEAIRASTRESKR